MTTDKYYKFRLKELNTTEFRFIIKYLLSVYLNLTSWFNSRKPVAWNSVTSDSKSCRLWTGAWLIRPSFQTSFPMVHFSSRCRSGCHPSYIRKEASLSKDSVIIWIVQSIIDI